MSLAVSGHLPSLNCSDHLARTKSCNRKNPLHRKRGCRQCSWIKNLSSGTGFNRSIRDVIIYDVNGYENRDKQHDYGAELEAGYSFNERLSIKINYTYVDGRITQKVAAKDTTYYNLIRRPKNNAHLFINYQLKKNFFISSSLQITGKRTDTYYDPVSFLPSEVDLKAYALWTYRIRFQKEETQPFC